MVDELRVLRPSHVNKKQADDFTQSDLAEFVGRQIRDLRQARDVTLAQLSKKTKLSVGYLSQVERNISTPSITDLYEISRALGVTISWFFPDANPAPREEREHIVRASRRRRIDFATGITDFLLSPNLNRQLELLCSRFEPGASSGDEPYTHKGEEAGVALSGKIDLWLSDKYFLLEEGDSFAFPSTTPHRYRNAGETEAVVIWAITPPSY